MGSFLLFFRLDFRHVVVLHGEFRFAFLSYVVAKSKLLHVGNVVIVFWAAKFAMIFFQWAFRVTLYPSVFGALAFLFCFGGDFRIGLPSFDIR